MKNKTLILTVLAALALPVLLLTGCAEADKIGDIKAYPKQYQGVEVNIKGTVGGNLWFALLTRGAYEVTDESGSIWVVCNTAPPEKNAIVRVRGTVESAVTVGDRSLGMVIVETKRGKG